MKFGMTGDTKVKVHMDFGTKLNPSLDKPIADLTQYRQLIGSLLYVTVSRLNIMFVACYCACYQANPRELHMPTMKNIFRYLKQTSSPGLQYPTNSGLFILLFQMLISEVVILIGRVLQTDVSF